MRMAPTYLLLPRPDARAIDCLPAVISVPAALDQTGSEDSVVDKPLAQATLIDLDAHLDLLGAQIAADTRCLRALTALRDQALALGATPETLVLATVEPAHPHAGD